MTPPSAAAPSGADASEGVGYTSPPKSSRRPGSTSTARRPSTASGAPRHADTGPPSISTPSLRTVAALYVQPGGAYYGVPGVDPWDETRDARTYTGPHPVVAHPPCLHWCKLSYCRPEIVRGADDGCFEAALHAVRTYGGVLEHPAHSEAFRRFGLPEPFHYGWTSSFFDSGLSALVDQRWYGHRCRKPTWIYVHGVEHPPSLVAGRGPRGKDLNNSHHGDGTDRSGTPAAFRDLLLLIARNTCPR